MPKKRKREEIEEEETKALFMKERKEAKPISFLDSLFAQTEKKQDEITKGNDEIFSNWKKQVLQDAMNHASCLTEHGKDESQCTTMDTVETNSMQITKDKEDALLEKAAKDVLKKYNLLSP